MTYNKRFFARVEKIVGSRYAMAQQTGLDESNLSKMYLGKRPISMVTFLTLCLCARLDPWELMPEWFESQHLEVSNEVRQWLADQTPRLRFMLGEPPSKPPP